MNKLDFITGELEKLKEALLLKGVFMSELEDRLKSSGEDVLNINDFFM